MARTFISSFTLLLLVLALAGAAHAQAGPPFITDDPDTPGNKHWEINLGWIGDRNPYEGNYQVPDFDINYGLGDRIQLKYEVPIAIHELRGGYDNAGVYTPPSAATVDVGLGESLLGIKWRFYEHKPKAAPPPKEAEAEGEAPEANFSIGTYPQLSLNNPTSSVSRNVVPPGPQFLLPLESNARIGPIRVDGEIGYWFTNQHVPQSWIRGLVIGHEFSKKMEAYLELHDQQDANTVGGAHKQRETTLGAGGRQSLNRENTFLLMLMAGRSFQRVVSGNGQPSWIAYVGVQILLGPKEKNNQVEQKIPDESGKK